MESHQPAVLANRRDGFPAPASSKRPAGLDGLEKHAGSKRDKVAAARLAGFERSYVFESRFVPLFLSRFFARIR